MAEVRLTRAKLEAALADFDTYGYGAADLGAGEVAVAAMRALLRVMEPTSDEDVEYEAGGYSAELLGKEHPDRDAAEADYTGGYRAAEARARRVANWSDDTSDRMMSSEERAAVERALVYFTVVDGEARSVLDLHVHIKALADAARRYLALTAALKGWEPRCMWEKCKQVGDALAAGGDGGGGEEVDGG